ncbi:c-type cytochrome [Vulcaniibacterium thermophilum]|jgi:cytochrome c553|uniref:Cytochrome C4 n=1 Tax=Vulcaniibacterium thermophilum TaxID=1169913 RepID=A0A918YV19_9GAMM|nr:cytochrome c [Vulcaniibacterium thermophilum]GHE26057.1 cytochrome C4 [Vulcaniibacterium thermophilum]
MTRPLTIAACTLLTTAVAAVALAQAPAASTSPANPPAGDASAPTPTALKGDPARGKQLTYTCHGCHGVEGYKNAYPSYHVPKIGGQSPEYLIAALNAYKQGTRKHPTMQAQAQSFSDQDIADIAAFLSNLK